MDAGATRLLQAEASIAHAMIRIAMLMPMCAAIVGWTLLSQLHADLQR